MFCAIGTFSLSNSTFDVYLMAVFGLLGYIFHKFGCEPAPMMLGFILGPMMEEFLRRALLLSKGDPMVLVTRPISAVMLGLAVVPAVHRADAGAAQEARGSVRGGRRMMKRRSRIARPAHCCPSNVSP